MLYPPVVIFFFEMKFELENERHHIGRAMVQKIAERGVHRVYCSVPHPLATSTDLYVDCVNPLSVVLEGVDFLKADLLKVVSDLKTLNCSRSTLQ